MERFGETVQGPVMALTRILLLLLLMSFLSVGCAVDSAGFKLQRMAFQSGGNKLWGTLVTPRQTTGEVPILIFIHGDGELNFDAFGYYRPFWEALAEKGVGAFVWDKPGVGGSSGNWERQSMIDRATEVEDAITFLRSQQELSLSRIGLIGFSQAGWVMPLVNADKFALCCMIFISTAIDWQQQGDYLTKQRLLQEGVPSEQITAQLQQEEQLNKKLFQASASYKDYESWYAESEQSVLKGSKLTPDRFHFIQLNWQSNASAGLRDLKVPVLALFGDHDLNVDAERNAREYRALFAASGHKDYTVKIIEDATHGLTNSDYLNRQLPGLTEVALINLMGRKVYASGVLELVAEWAASRLND